MSMLKEKPIPVSDAQSLMPRNTLSTAIERLNESIRRAAALDKTEVRIDWLCDIKGDNVALTELGRRVVQIFEAEGYEASEFYECRQFVDVGMKLTWPAAPNEKD